MMGYVFAVAAMRDGREVTYLPAYGAEMRGGTANCTVVVSDEEIFSPVASSPDLAVIMNKPSLLKYEGTMREGGVIFSKFKSRGQRIDKRQPDCHKDTCH